MVARLEIDAVIGDRYRLKRPIAQGGMAEVWLAVDEQLTREVAIKLLKEHIAHDPVVATRFRNEATALAKLRHPNIVGIHDVVFQDERLYLVMEYIQGRSLRETLDELAARSHDKKGRLSPETTVHIGRSIALALHHAHQRGFLHRDIKPANILVQSTGAILLTDFGIAKEIGASGNDLTNENIMMGTAKYLSPELVGGKDVTQRSDLYALGIVLYECLAGEAPFRGRNDQETAMNRLRADATPLEVRSPSVPFALTQVVHKMMERKPEHRYENGTDVANALQAALAGSPDAPTPPVGVADRRTGAPTTHHDPTYVGAPAVLDPLLSSNGSPSSPRPRNSRDPRTEHDRHERDPRATPTRPRDRTPKKVTRPQRTLPATRQSSSKRSLIPVAVLVVVALVIAGVVWRNIRSSSSSSTLTKGDTPSSVAVVSFRSYDPNGDDKEENESAVALMFDGDSETVWTTKCYKNKYFGSKQGVGVVLQLSEPSGGQVSVSMQNGPYAIEVYGSDTIPNTLGGWGERVGKTFSTNAGVAKVAFDNANPYVLVWFTEAGDSAGCSTENPFRAEVSSIQFATG